MRRFCWRLGVEQRGPESDLALIGAAEATMRESDIGPDDFFFRHRGGRAAEGRLAEALAGYAPLAGVDTYWQESLPVTMLIDEVETLWDTIAQRDDWKPLEAKIAAVRRMGHALGNPPVPAGHGGNPQAWSQM